MNTCKGHERSVECVEISHISEVYKCIISLSSFYNIQLTHFIFFAFCSQWKQHLMVRLGPSETFTNAINKPLKACDRLKWLRSESNTFPVTVALLSYPRTDWSCEFTTKESFSRNKTLHLVIYLKYMIDRFSSFGHIKYTLKLNWRFIFTLR